MLLRSASILFAYCVRSKSNYYYCHCAKKPVTTMLTYPWKCTVLHCNHLGNTWKPLVLMTRHFDYCPRASSFQMSSIAMHSEKDSMSIDFSNMKHTWNVVMYLIIWQCNTSYLDSTVKKGVVIGGWWIL